MLTGQMACDRALSADKSLSTLGFSLLSFESWTSFPVPRFYNLIRDINSSLITEDLSMDNEVKHICIIGAGSAGLAALKSIMDTSQYQKGLWKPVAFEARNNVGGVW